LPIFLGFCKPFIASSLIAVFAAPAPGSSTGVACRLDAAPAR
jgi:hypothetical protein